MRILICDDHRLFADSLGSMLRARGHDVATAADPAEAIEIATTDRADVCTMDLSFGDRDISTTLRAIGALRSLVDVVVLSGHDDDHHRDAALTAGAAAFASKSLCGDDLVGCIERGAASVQVGPTPIRPRSGPSVYFLTEREREVLDSLVEGHSTAMIAAHLGVRVATARSHVQSVLMKLGVHSRLAAVAFAVERGLVNPAA